MLTSAITCCLCPPIIRTQLMLAADRHAFKKNLEELNQLLSRHSKKIKEVEKEIPFTNFFKISLLQHVLREDYPRFLTIWRSCENLAQKINRHYDLILDVDETSILSIKKDDTEAIKILNDYNAELREKEEQPFKVIDTRFHRCVIAPWLIPVLDDAKSRGLSILLYTAANQKAHLNLFFHLREVCRYKFDTLTRKDPEILTLPKESPNDEVLCLKLDFLGKVIIFDDTKSRWIIDDSTRTLTDYDTRFPSFTPLDSQLFKNDLRQSLYYMKENEALFKDFLISKLTPLETAEPHQQPHDVSII